MTWLALYAGLGLLFALWLKRIPETSALSHFVIGTVCWPIFVSWFVISYFRGLARSLRNGQ